MRQATFMRILAALFAVLVLSTADSWAHCDTMDGPVVQAARRALDQGDVRYALVWVQPTGEAEIRAAFTQARTVRALGGEARSLADRYFFETLVRIHRAGEGAPYEGLKDSDIQPEPGIAAAEAALAANSTKTLTDGLGSALHHGIDEAFERVQTAKTYQPTDVDAGRRYVQAYVTYIHYVERLHQTIAPRGGKPGTPAEHDTH
jgi:hypothetical protein